MSAWRWFLARHGETDGNLEGRAQGQTDTPLNDTGHAQARALAGRLDSVRFEAAYASDLRRAVDTAMPIMAARDTELTVLTGLREKHFGEWEGMTFGEVEARYADLYAEMFLNDPSFAPPGGESDLQLLDQVSAVVRRVTARHSRTGGNLLVVSHGGALSAMIISLLGLPVDSMWRLRLSNAGLSIATVFDDGGATLDLMNDTSHLGANFET